MGIIGDDATILSNLVKSIKLAGEAGEPKEAIKTAGLFFIIGAVPILIPFFVGVMGNLAPFIPAVTAFVVAVFTISTAGFFVAVLSGKRYSSRSFTISSSSWGLALSPTGSALRPGSF
jgi:VIT1/CCC1 family predicted Fe2+/Mn2+ transporter